MPDGTWSFTGAAGTALKPGSYTVTPTKTNYTFYPTSSAQTITNADISGVDFVSTAWLLYDEFTTSESAPISSPTRASTARSIRRIRDACGAGDCARQGVPHCECQARPHCSRAVAHLFARIGDGTFPPVRTHRPRAVAHMPKLGARPRRLPTGRDSIPPAARRNRAS